MPIKSYQAYLSPSEAETAFYQAFANCNVKAMEQLWAKEDVVCVHPGSPAIVGYDAVIRSWNYIFDGAELPEIQFALLSETHTDGLAVRVVEEHISTGTDSSAVLLATNVYRKLNNYWLMIEHHGSIIHAQPEKHTIQ